MKIPLHSTRIALAFLLSAALATLSFAGNGNGNANGKNKVSPPPPAPVVTSYSGRATALVIDDVVVPVPGPIILADSGALASTGGSLEASESNYVLHGSDGVTVALGVELAYAAAVGSGPETTVDSNLNGLRILLDTPAGERVSITADYIAASASAAVAANGSTSAQGSISVTNLQVNGAVIAVTDAPNQTVTIPGGHIVLNEQVIVSGNGSADIVLTAVHFYIDGCMNGAFGQVHAGITAGSNPPPPDHDCGKLTGGGWIVGPSGEKATFGVSGGIRRGEFWGHLEYNDHGAGLKVKSTRVTNYIPNPRVPDCRIISYEVEINGIPGTATVDAWDRGEPGRDDFFSIKLSTGYSARGTLGGDGPGGGNLQLHKCPPGWDK